MIKKTLLAVILVLFLTSCSNKSTDQVSPYLNFEKGFSQTLVVETKTSATKDMSFQESREIQFQLDTVTKDSSFVFTGKIIRMIYKSDMFGEKEGFDTQVVKAINNTSKMSASELEIYNEIKNTLDKEFTIILDKRGNLLKTATFKDGTYIDPEIAKSYTVAPIIFPDEKLAVGYSWEFNTENPIIPTQKIKHIYTVDNITADKIILDVKVEINALSTLLESNVATGVYEIDRKTKRFIKGQREMKLQIGGGKAIYKIYEQ
ncbi:hypothetical protein [Kordia sp.]|uniref:hypothetical protein n=1 Tax=Kordia sp. TaxID=1965332 RepID=UPI003D2DA209